MSKQRLIDADYCEGLAVRGSGSHESGQSAPSELQKTDSTDLSTGSDAQNEPTVISSQTVIPPDSGLNNLDKWIQSLNQSLLEQQGDKAAQTSLLTHAIQALDEHARQLTEDFRESEPVMKPVLKKASKKVQKHVIRCQDAELKTVNRRLHQVRLVRKQVECCLSQVCREDQLKPILLKVLEELEKPAEVSRAQAGVCRFFRDVLLCVLLSMLVFALVSLLMVFIM